MPGGTEELLAEARDGDDAAYEALFARVGPRLLLYVRLRMGPGLQARMDPLDVLQETYLQAHRDFARFQQREPGAFCRWLLRIADNRIRDLADHVGAQKRCPGREAARDPQVLERLRAEEAGPGTESGLREERALLVQALQTLEADQREALLLRFFHGLTLEEIATRMGISEPSVRRALAAGQVALGRHLRSLQE